MTIWGRIDGALTQITAFAETVSTALRRASDRVLAEVAHAVDVVYRFIRKMLINFAKIVREFSKLAVVVLFFLFLLTLGLEVKPQSALAGWLLLVLGVLGLVGIVFSFLASFHRSGVPSAPSDDLPIGERTPALQRYSTFLLLDLLVVLALAAWGLKFDYRFHTLLLRSSQDLGELFVIKIYIPILHFFTQSAGQMR